MSVVGKARADRSYKTRCDGCGRITSDRDGYYIDKATGEGGTINSKGRGCEHDFCRQCEDTNYERDKDKYPELIKVGGATPCPKCGWRPDIKEPSDGR